jgi:hypothetical protein
MSRSWLQGVLGGLVVGLVILVGGGVAQAQTDTLGGGMVGGSANGCGGSDPANNPTSRPALFDTDGVPGPSLGDTPAYFGSPTRDRQDTLNGTVYPVCGPGETNSFELFAEGQRQGVYDLVYVGADSGFFQADLDTDGELVGGTYTDFGDTTEQHDLSLTSSTRAGVYDGVSVSGGGIVASADLEGWDIAGRDGTPEYIGINWAGVGDGFVCNSYLDSGPGPEITDATMLWVPVIPAGTRAGEVTIGIDMDCEFGQDPDFPTSPTLTTTIVPVELQSFTVASLLPTNRTSLVLYLLAGGVLLIVHRLRHRLPALPL